MTIALKRRIEKLECSNDMEESLIVFIKRFGLGYDRYCAECEGLQLLKDEGESEDAFMSRAANFFDNELGKSPTPVRVAYLKHIDHIEAA